MLCFSRDDEIGDAIQSTCSKTKSTDDASSGIVPFHGICMFAAPFCYIYDSPIKLYFAFRAFFIRYCYHLTTVNTHCHGIVSMCLLFEKLLQTHEPHLWSYFRDLGIPPWVLFSYFSLSSLKLFSITFFSIRIVFKWIARAFSGHLPPEELLILWDLVSSKQIKIVEWKEIIFQFVSRQILGYDSLEVIPLLAIVILSFRKESLLQVSTLENIEALLSDLSSIKVLPLLRLVLSLERQWTQSV